ncbi:hypothetical protein Z043_125120, partial [Scleropages formosus]
MQPLRGLLGFGVVCSNKDNFPAKMVSDFLQRYMEVLSSHRSMRHQLGFWNGKRQFQIRLHSDPKGFNSFSHPPAASTIGAEEHGSFFIASGGKGNPNEVYVTFTPR